eukprot:767436-Hanusia_phi.AAC.7
MSSFWCTINNHHETSSNANRAKLCNQCDLRNSSVLRKRSKNLHSLSFFLSFSHPHHFPSPPPPHKSSPSPDIVWRQPLSKLDVLVCGLAHSQNDCELAQLQAFPLTSTFMLHCVCSFAGECDPSKIPRLASQRPQTGRGDRAGAGGGVKGDGAAGSAQAALACTLLNSSPSKWHNLASSLCCIFRGTSQEKRREVRRRQQRTSNAR